MAQISIVSYNCKNIKTSISDVYELCKNYKIVLLQEHWLPKQELSFLNSIHPEFISFGVSAFDYGNGLLRGRPYGGIAILVHKDLADKCKPEFYDDSRLIGLKVMDQFSSFLVICCYLPYDNGENLHEYVAYLGKIYSIIDEWPYNKVIVGGDLNAHPNSQFFEEVANWCEEMGLSIADSQLLPPDTYTFVDYGNGSTRWLDHFIVSPSMYDLQMEIKVLDKFALSDHLPITLTFHVNSIVDNDNRDTNRVANTIDGTKVLRPKESRAYIEKTERLLSEIYIPVDSLAACNTPAPLNDFHALRISKFYEDIVNGLRLFNDGQQVDNDNHANYNQVVGWNEFVREDHAHARHCYSLWRDFGRPQQGLLFHMMRHSRAQFKRSLHVCKRLKDEILADRLALTMDLCHTKFWKEISRLRTNKAPLPLQVGDALGEQEIASMWKQIYSSHMNVYPREIDEYTRGYMNRRDINDNDTNVSANEVEGLISKLKLGKAAGSSGIFSENLRYASKRLYVLLALLFQACLKSNFIPKKMVEILISPVIKDKNGNVTDKTNYRPIAIANILSKLFELLILSKVEKYLETNDNQFAFKKGHSTDHAIFLLKEVIAHYQNNGTPVFICFMDVSKAYDKVNQGILFRKLVDRGIPPFIIRTLVSWYEQQSFQVQWGNAQSSSFTTTCGLRQGSLLSPILFNVFMDGLSDKLKESGVGLHIGDEWYNNFMYADDVVLVSPSASGLQNLINICEQYARIHDVIYNATKTVVMNILPRRYKIEQLPAFHLCERELNYVNEYKYLGHYVTTKLTDDRDIAYRYRDVAVKGNIISRMFVRCSPPVKVKLFKTFCSNIYCNQLWVKYTQRALSKLTVCYNNSFRILMGLSFSCSASDMFARNNLRSFKEIRRFSINSFINRLFISQNRLIKNIMNCDMFFKSLIFQEYILQCLV